MNLSYYQIRETCQLVDYAHKLVGNSSLWIETYCDNTHTYSVLFSPHSNSDLPLTITKHETST